MDQGVAQIWGAIIVAFASLVVGIFTAARQNRDLHLLFERLLDELKNSRDDYKHDLTKVLEARPPVPLKEPTRDEQPTTSHETAPDPQKPKARRSKKLSGHLNLFVLPALWFALSVSAGITAIFLSAEKHARVARAAEDIEEAFDIYQPTSQISDWQHTKGRLDLPSLAKQIPATSDPYLLGLKALAEGKAPQAIFLFRDAIKELPSGYKPHLALGRSYASIDDSKDSLDEIARANTLKPSDPFIVDVYVTSLLTNNKPDLAKGFAQRSVTLADEKYPGNLLLRSKTRQNLGNALLNLKVVSRSDSHASFVSAQTFFREAYALIQRQPSSITKALSCSNIALVEPPSSALRHIDESERILKDIDQQGSTLYAVDIEQGAKARAMMLDPFKQIAQFRNQVIPSMGQALDLMENNRPDSNYRLIECALTYGEMLEQAENWDSAALALDRARAVRAFLPSSESTQFDYKFEIAEGILLRHQRKSALALRSAEDAYRNATSSVEQFSARVLESALEYDIVKETHDPKAFRRAYAELINDLSRTDLNPQQRATLRGNLAKLQSVRPGGA